jgi:hypothetical protein
LFVLPSLEAEYKNHLFGAVEEGMLQNHLLKTVKFEAKLDKIGT